MSHFLTHVVLHGITDHAHQKYHQLHAAMESARFSRKITGTDGRVFHLPPAEYSCYSNKTLAQIRDVARAVANTITVDNGVIVCEGHCAWDGLKPA